MASLPLTSSVNLGFRSLPTCRTRSSKPSSSPTLNLKSNTENQRNHSKRHSLITNPYIGTSFTFKSITKTHTTYNSSFPTRNLTVKASAAAVPAKQEPPPPPQPWQGAAMKPLIASLATGIILWFVPQPAGVSRNAWQLLSIFLATIIGIITQPLPLGAVALMGLGACVLTKTLTFAAAFSAFGDPIPWLIALAFFFARGFIKTGLGNRIAYQFVSLFGSSSLGLGYMKIHDFDQQPHPSKHLHVLQMDEKMDQNRSMRSDCLKNLSHSRISHPCSQPELTHQLVRQQSQKASLRG